MAKPTELGEWATNPGQTLEPSAPQKAAGFIEGDKPPARWINWLWNVAHQWHAYTSNLHGEAEFLNKAYAWTGLHRFAQGFIANSWGVQGEVLYCDADGTVTPKERTIRIPNAAFIPTVEPGASAPGWQFSNSYYWTSNAPVAFPAPLVAEVLLPAGVVLKGVRAEVFGADITGYVGRVMVTEGAGSSSLVFTSVGSGSPDGSNMINIPVPSPPTLTSEQVVQVRFETSSASLRLYWCKLIVDDPGPRNF